MLVQIYWQSCLELYLYETLAYGYKSIGMELEIFIVVLHFIIYTSNYIL